MPKYKVENLLNTQVTLEDLGITLAPRGGVDSTQFVDSVSFERSKSAKSNAKYIRATPINDAQPAKGFKLWGINKVQEKPAPPEPVAPALKVNIESSPQIRAMANHVEGLDKKVDEVIRMLRLGITIGSGSVGIPSASTKEASSTVGFVDPMYIPTSITPAKVGDSNVQVSSQTSEAGSLDEAAAALRNLKKSKKV